MRTQVEYKIMTEAGVFIDKCWFDKTLSLADVYSALAHIGYVNVVVEGIGE